MGSAGCFSSGEGFEADEGFVENFLEAFICLKPFPICFSCPQRFVPANKDYTIDGPTTNLLEDLNRCLRPIFVSVGRKFSCPLPPLSRFSVLDVHSDCSVNFHLSLSLRLNMSLVVEITLSIIHPLPFGVKNEDVFLTICVKCLVAKSTSTMFGILGFKPPAFVEMPPLVLLYPTGCNSGPARARASPRPHLGTGLRYWLYLQGDRSLRIAGLFQ